MTCPLSEPSVGGIAVGEAGGMAVEVGCGLL